MSGRHPVLEGAAKAYWASGYADAVDNWDEDNPDVGVPFHAPFDMTIGHHEGWRTGEAAYDAVVEEMG